jgi:hypothetical protein
MEGLGRLQHRALLPEFVRDPSYAERDELLLRKPLGSAHREGEGLRDRARRLAICVHYIALVPARVHPHGPGESLALRP